MMSTVCADVRNGTSIRWLVFFFVFFVCYKHITVIAAKYLYREGGYFILQVPAPLV